MSDITADVRLQTSDREHTQGHVEGVIAAMGPLPDLAVAAMAATAGDRGTQIASHWTPLSQRRRGVLDFARALICAWAAAAVAWEPRGAHHDVLGSQVWHRPARIDPSWTSALTLKRHATD